MKYKEDEDEENEMTKWCMGLSFFDTIAACLHGKVEMLMALFHFIFILASSLCTYVGKEMAS